MMHDQELIYNTVSETPRTVKEIIAIAYPDKLESDQRRCISHTNRVLRSLVEEKRIKYTVTKVHGSPTRVFYIGNNPTVKYRHTNLDEMALSVLTKGYATTREVTERLYPMNNKWTHENTRKRLMKLREKGFVEGHKNKDRLWVWRLKE